MFEETKSFYELTKVHEPPTLPSGGSPITHTQIFYKEYPRFETVELPLPVQSGSTLDDCFARRSSERTFTEEALTLHDISAVMRSCRVIDTERLPERRTYPSAGARFPIEAYLLAFRVEGLDTGCYHLKVRTNELEVLWPADLAARADEIVSPFVSEPAAAIVLTSVISRAEIKYGHKAYPFSLLEAGHMAQNMILAGAANKIGGCPVGGFVDDTIAELLDLTSDEIPLYVIALGKTDRQR